MTFQFEDVAGGVQDISVEGHNSTSGNNHGGNIVNRSGDGHGTQTCGTLQWYFGKTGQGGATHVDTVTQALILSMPVAGTTATMDLGTIIYSIQCSGTRYILNNSGGGSLEISSNGTVGIRVGDGLLGFFGASSVAKPTVSGSRADPEQALADLLAELHTLGLINNTTTS